MPETLQPNLHKIRIDGKDEKVSLSWTPPSARHRFVSVSGARDQQVLVFASIFLVHGEQMNCGVMTVTVERKRDLRCWPLIRFPYHRNQNQNYEVLPPTLGHVFYRFSFVRHSRSDVAFKFKSKWENSIDIFRPVDVRRTDADAKDSIVQTVDSCDCVCGIPDLYRHKILYGKLLVNGSGFKISRLPKTES